MIGYNVNTPSDFRFYFTGSQTGDFAFSPDGSKLYIYSYGNSYVMVFDLNTGQQLAGTPIALGPDLHLQQRLVNIGQPPDGYGPGAPE